MTKEKFIKLFFIEDAKIKSILFENNNLIIIIENDIYKFAMGNNIRDESNQTYYTKYIFINTNQDKVILDKEIEYIYNSYLNNNIIYLKTNKALLEIDCEKVLVEGV